MTRGRGTSLTDSQISQRRPSRKAKVDEVKNDEDIIEIEDEKDTKSDIEELKKDPNYGEKPEIQNENAAKKTLS
jgi:hypothetical protein